MPWVSDFDQGLRAGIFAVASSGRICLGNQLGGLGKDLRNLVPLYRQANVPGMGNVEDYLANRINQGNDTIFYSVNAHYRGDSPYPHTITMLWSSSVTVEAGFCMVYNTSAGTRTPGCLPTD